MLTKAARIKNAFEILLYVSSLLVYLSVRSFLITSCGLKPLASVLNFSLSFSIPHMLLKSVLDEFHLNQANWFETGAATPPDPPPHPVRLEEPFWSMPMPFVCLPCFFFFLVCNGESRDPTNDNCPTGRGLWNQHTQTCICTITTGEQTGSYMQMECYYCIINLFMHNCIENKSIGWL